MTSEEFKKFRIEKGYTQKKLAELDNGWAWNSSLSGSYGLYNYLKDYGNRYVRPVLVL